MNDTLSESDSKAVNIILTEQLGIKPEQLRLEARLLEDLGADSLTLVELTMALEDRFNVSIPDERWERVGTIGELYKALAELLEK